MSVKTVDRSQDVLQGRVAQILNERELVINIGSDQGVKPGMKFSVLSETPVEIHDPQSGELLDTVDREKVRVQATEIRQKITICKTYVKRKIGGGALYSSDVLAGIARATDAFRPPIEIVDTLKATDKSLPPPLSPEESYVKINDRVVLIGAE